MTTTAQDPIDQLIPPPWPWGRRLALAAVVALVAAVVVGAWWVGLLGPRLAPVGAYDAGPVTDEATVRSVVETAEEQGDGIVLTEDGGREVDGVVEVRLEVRNRGLRPVEELRLATVGPVMAAGEVVGGIPVDVPARGEAHPRFYLVVQDCTQLSAGPQPLTFSARSAGFQHDGRTLQVRGDPRWEPTWPSDAEADASWWYHLAAMVCDPIGDGQAHPIG